MQPANTWSFQYTQLSQLGELFDTVFNKHKSYEGLWLDLAVPAKSLLREVSMLPRRTGEHRESIAEKYLEMDPKSRSYHQRWAKTPRKRAGVDIHRHWWHENRTPFVPSQYCSQPGPQRCAVVLQIPCGCRRHVGLAINLLGVETSQRAPHDKEGFDAEDMTYCENLCGAMLWPLDTQDFRNEWLLTPGDDHSIIPLGQ